DRQLQLRERLERLEYQDVDAALDQRLDLLAEGRARFRQRNGPGRREQHADRADRAGDEHGLALDLAGVAGKADGGEVDVVDTGLQPEAGQPLPRRAEGVRLDQVGAGGDVLLVEL